MSDKPTPTQGLLDQSDQPNCVLCGRCLSVCPLFAATGREELSPRAKFFLTQALASGQLDLASTKPADLLTSVCLSCGKCESACPLGLCGPDLAARVRAAHPGFAGYLWKLWIERAGLIWPLAKAVAKFVPKGLPIEAITRAKASLDALGSGQAPAPWLFPESFDRRHAGQKAVLFAGCVAEYASPRWKDMAKRLLAGLGIEVLPDPGFTCCGSPLGHAGALDAQTAMQRHNIEAWRQAGRPMMVVFCATCRYGLRSYTQKDLGLTASERETWNDGLVSLSGLLGDTTFRTGEAAPPAGRYHRPCHGADDNQDLAMLRRAMGERLVFHERETPCCGFGGLTKLTAPELSDLVAARAFAIYAPKPGDQIITGCAGCVTQLRASAPKGVIVGHWLEIMG